MRQIQERGSNDPDPMNLLPELEVERMLLAMALMKIGKDEARTQVCFQGAGSGGIAQNCLIGNPDVDIQAQFSIDSKQVILVSELSQNIVDTVTKIHQIHNRNSITKSEISWLITTLKRGIAQFVPLENRPAFFQWFKEQKLETDVEAES